MNKKKIIAQFCMFLIVMLPICFADEFEQEGESLIIEAKKYEPEVLRSDYMEQLNIPVRIILGAIRGAPISVPEIKTVDVRLIKKQEAQKENATVQGTSDQTVKDYVQGTPKFYKAPYPTLDNLGFVQITLKKIPQEHQVPKTIDLDFRATITYEADITAFTIGGENTKSLKQSTVGTVKEFPEEYSILGGRYYLRVTSIRSQEATVEILDSEFKLVTTRTLRLADTLTSTSTATSTSISLPDEVTEPKSIRLKLEEVRNVGAVKLSFKENKEKSFEKGQEIDSGWKVYNYYLGSAKKENYDYIMLSHKEFRPQIILTTERGYSTIADIKQKIESCTSTKCEIYKDSSTSSIKSYQVEKETFQEALRSLESIELEGIKGIETQGAEFIAKIEEGGVVYDYRKGDKIGSKNCKCTISSITRDRLWVMGARDCDQQQRINTVELKVNTPENICRTILELKEITTDQEAIITILPGTGKGKTTTYFSVHIPVEKRLIQYTPEELQNKINKTQELIKKLDNTITKLQTLVEGWTKVCLATAAVFTVMSFFQGVSGKTPEKQEGTKPGEQGTPAKAGEEIKIQPPDGVKFSDLKYGYDTNSKLSGRSLSLQDNSAYYFVGGAMYDSNNKYVAHEGAKFRSGEGEKAQWYVLTLEGKLEKIEGSYGNWKAGDESGRSEVRFSPNEDVAVGLQDCNQIPLGPGNYRNQCLNSRATYGSALTLVYFKKVDSIEVWSAGADRKFYMNENGKQDGDQKLFDINPQSSEFKDIKRRMIEMQDEYKRGTKNYNWGGYKYDMGKLFTSGTGATDVDCRMVMSEGQCKILFNACDPVMCPASRCNLAGRYRVPNDDVIRSGLIGSLILCLPNIKGGVIMPVCLSGILAALKNIRSILQGYVNCLQSALQDDQSVGVCDRIRSIFICQILWREAMTLIGLARGNLFDFVAGGGGGEYLTGVKGGVDNAKKTLDYFTGDYAKSVFAAYRGRSSEEIGAMVCEKAIYGKIPIVGDILEDVTKAQNPIQFTAYIEEQPLYTQTGQESVYKLYYHIYAGAQKLDYKVYVKKGTKTYICSECSGTLDPEGFVDKSTLFTQEQGYKEICVVINGKHECNIGRVISTSFGINQVNNYIMQQELSKNVQTEEACRSDVRGYIPQAQIDKICSIVNPATGKGSAEESLWRKVGTCGKNKEGAFLGDCWMKLGELAQSNPEVYRSVVGGLCEDEGGKVCEQYQTCSGRQSVTAVKERYKNVVCCYGTCETDQKYEDFKVKARTFSEKDTAYSEVYSKGVERCEDKEIATSDPFYPTDQLPTSWIEKIKNVKTEDKKEIAYFKGLMYLLCSNCGDAAKEFNTIPKEDTYFKEACGENKAEEGKGGLVFEKCQKTCEGKTTASAKPVAETTKPEEIKPLQLTKIVIITPSDQEKDLSITENQKEIELETGGIYKIKRFVFDKPVSSCHFYYETDLAKSGEFEKGAAKIGESEGSTICNFKDTPISAVGVADKSTIEIGAADKETQKDYTYNLNIKILEKSAQEGQVLLCENQAGSQAFCISPTTEYKGKRCSDFSYTGKNYKYKSDYTNVNSCNSACTNTNYGDCITKDNLYLTPKIAGDNSIAVQ